MMSDKNVVAYLSNLSKKHPEMFENEADVLKLINEVKNNPTHFFTGSNLNNAFMVKELQNGKFGKIAIQKDGEFENLITHATKSSKKNTIQKGVEKQLEGSPTPSLSNSFNTVETKADTNVYSVATNDIINNQNLNKPTLQELLNHPRLEELLKMRENVKAQDVQYNQKLETKQTINHFNNGAGYETEVFPATYSKNWNADFLLTKSDVKNIRDGKLNDEIIKKLELDLGRLDNDPNWTKVENSIKPNGWSDEYFNDVLKNVDMSKKPKDMSEKDWVEAHSLFAKGGDNLAVAFGSSIEEDENGGYSVNPEKFVLALGGYSAVKSIVTNPKVQNGVKDLLEHGLRKIEDKAEAGDMFAKSILGVHYMAPGNPINKTQKNIVKVLQGEKPSTQIGKDEKTPLILEKGEMWEFNNNIKGFGLEKIIAKHVQKQGDLNYLEIIKSPEIMKKSESYQSKGNLVFDFPNKEQPKIRIVFSDAVDENGNLRTLPNGQTFKTEVSMFRRKDGRRVPVIPDNGFTPFGVSPSGVSDLQSSNIKTLLPQNLEDNKLNPNMRGGFVDSSALLESHNKFIDFANMVYDKSANLLRGIDKDGNVKDNQNKILQTIRDKFNLHHIWIEFIIF